MLTGYQCEVVAFIGDGEFICRDCAHRALDEGQLAQSELGLGSLSPVIRYSLDEANGERVWEAAEEQLREFIAEHPWSGLVLQEISGYGHVHWTIGGDKILSKIAERLEELYAETCGECNEVIK